MVKEESIKIRNRFPCSACRFAARRCRWDAGDESCVRCLEQRRICSGPTSADGNSTLKRGTKRSRGEEREVTVYSGRSPAEDRLDSVALSSLLKYHLLNTFITSIGTGISSFPAVTGVSNVVNQVAQLCGKTSEMSPSEELFALSMMLDGAYLSSHTAITRGCTDVQQLGRARKDALEAFGKHVIDCIAKVLAEERSQRNFNGATLLGLFQAASSVHYRVLFAHGLETLGSLIKYTVEALPSLDADSENSPKPLMRYFVKLLAMHGYRANMYHLAIPPPNGLRFRPFPPAPSTHVIQTLCETLGAQNHPLVTTLFADLKHLTAEMSYLLLFELFSPLSQTFPRAILILRSSAFALERWIDGISQSPNLERLARQDNENGLFRLLQPLLFYQVQSLNFCRRCCEVAPRSWQVDLEKILSLILSSLARGLSYLMASTEAVITLFELHELVAQGSVPAIYDVYESQRYKFLNWAQVATGEVEQLAAVMRYAAPEAFEACEFVAVLDKLRQHSSPVNVYANGSSPTESSSSSRFEGSVGSSNSSMGQAKSVVDEVLHSL